MSINHRIWSIFEAIWGVSQTTWAIKYELFVKKKPFRSLIFINLRLGDWGATETILRDLTVLPFFCLCHGKTFDQAPGLINAVMAFLLKNV